MSSPHIKIENETAIIKLSDSLIIDNANDIHKLFSEASENNIPVILDLGAAKSCDCTFLQLMVSLCFSLSNKGLRLDVTTESVPHVVLDTVRSLGFNCKNSCTRLKNAQCLMSRLSNLGVQGKESGTL
jgi:anti-anti-sigma regulatory factor